MFFLVRNLQNPVCKQRISFQAFHSHMQLVLPCSTAQLWGISCMKVSVSLSKRVKLCISSLWQWVAGRNLGPEARWLLIG